MKWRNCLTRQHKTLRERQKMLNMTYEFDTFSYQRNMYNIFTWRQKNGRILCLHFVNQIWLELDESLVIWIEKLFIWATHTHTQHIIHLSDKTFVKRFSAVVLGYNFTSPCNQLSLWVAFASTYVIDTVYRMTFCVCFLFTLIRCKFLFTSYQCNRIHLLCVQIELWASWETYSTNENFHFTVRGRQMERTRWELLCFVRWNVNATENFHFTQWIDHAHLNTRTLNNSN